MSDCRKIEELLWEYPDLPEDKRELVARHLESCPDCRETLETIKALRDSKDADRAEVAMINPVGFDDSVFRKIRREKSSGSSAPSNRRYVMQMTVSVGLAAAIVIFMIISISDLADLPSFREAGKPSAQYAPQSAVGSFESDSQDKRMINIKLQPRRVDKSDLSKSGPLVKDEIQSNKSFSILLNPVTTPSPDSVNIDAVYLSDESVPFTSQIARGSISEIVADTGMVQSVTPPSGTLVTVEKMPRAVKLVPPEYPVWAKKRGLSGVVWVKARIDQTGKVTEASVYSSSVHGAGFEEAALKAAKASTYLPAESNGVKLPVWIMYPVKFIYKNN